MITVYGMKVSGNCWKAAQILRLRGIPFEWVEVDGNSGATRSPDYLAINPFGKVPAVRLDDGAVIVESNAILAHFAEGTSWLPPAGLPRTRVMEWLFFEQYSHEPYIAVARNIIAYRREKHLHAARIAQCHEAGARALDAMQARLAAHDWLTDAGPTIADLSLFAYTHVAHEGEFDLAKWPGVCAWIDRVTALPGIVPLVPKHR
jgi:glutathione S-transferase